MAMPGNLHHLAGDIAELESIAVFQLEIEIDRFEADVLIADYLGKLVEPHLAQRSHPP